MKIKRRSRRQNSFIDAHRRENKGLFELKINMLSVSTIFAILNWSLVLLSIFVYILVFIIYIILIKQPRENDATLLLTVNTCLSGFVTAIALLIMVSSNLFNEFLLINLNLCYIIGLLYDIFECSIYYSYCLQAFYRFFRVIYYRKRSLLSLKLYKYLILIQWLLATLLIIPTIFLQWYIHLPTEKFCLIPYTNITGSIYLIIVLYSIPLITIIIIYILITKHIRITTAIRIQERQRNLRDLTVIKRIIICVLILILLRFPTIIFIIFGIINGYLYSLTYAIVGFITSLCLIFIGLISILITNKFNEQIRKYFNQVNNRIQPIQN